MGETDYHMVQYLCREVRSHLERLSEDKDRRVKGRYEFAKELERSLHIGVDQMIASLKRLERSIDSQDVELILDCEPMIDDLVDFLDRRIDTVGRKGFQGGHEMPIQELITWRESTGKLAQLLCQSTE